MNNIQINSFKKSLSSALTKSLLPAYSEPEYAYGGGSFMVGGSISGTGVYVTPTTVRQLSAMTACINILSEDVAKIPFYYEEFNQKNGWSTVPETVPSGYVVKYPSDRFTMKEILRLCIDDLIMNGNAYIVIVRNSDMSVKNFVYVNYNSVGVYENEEGNLVYKVTSKQLCGFSTSVQSEDGSTRTISCEDIIHLKKNVINGEYIGRGIIYTSSEVFGLGLAAQETAVRTFNNGCTINGFIKTDNVVNPEQAAKIKTAFMEAQGGVSKAGTPAVLSGVDFVKTGMSPADVQLEQARDHQKKEIASILRIPLYKLAIEVSGETSTLEQQEQAYIHNTLSYYTDLISEEFNRKVLDRSQIGKYRFHFDFTSIAMPDFKTRMDAWATARSVGFVTSDYVAGRENLPIPGKEGYGDVYCLPMNLGTMNGKDDTPLGVSNHDVTGQSNEQQENTIQEIE